MVSLTSVNYRPEVTFTLLSGGAGVVRGILTEAEQNAQPSYVFTQPRHVLRTRHPSAVRAGMVMRSPGGAPFIVGENGPSEQREGTIWNSYRLFAPSGQYVWTRRTTVLDTITRQQKEGEPEQLGLIWAALEPLDREQADLSMRVSFEQLRFITGADIQPLDMIDGRPISKVDRQLGLSIGVLS